MRGPHAPATKAVAMASPNDYRKPRNKELKDLTWSLPHPLRVVDEKGSVLWENRAATQLEGDTTWEENPLTWQGRKAILQTAATAAGVPASKVKELEDEVGHLKKQQRQTARKKRQAETALEKAQKKFDGQLKKLESKLEKAEKSTKSEGADPKAAQKLAKAEKSLEKSQKELEKLKSESDSLRKDLKRAREESGRRLEDVERCRRENATQAESLFKALEKASNLEEQLQEAPDSAEFEEKISQLEEQLNKSEESLAAAAKADDDNGSATEELQTKIASLEEDKKSLEAWVEELEQKKDAAEKSVENHETALADTIAAFEDFRKQMDEESAERELQQQLSAKVAEFEALERTLEAEQKTFEDEKKRLQEQLAEQEDEVEKLKVGISEEPGEEVTELKEDLAEAKTSLESALRREKRLNEKLDTLEELRGEHSKVLEMLKDDLEESRERERELKSTVKLYADAHKETETIRGEVKTLRDQLDTLKQSEADLKKKLQAKELIRSESKDPGSEETLSLSVKNQIDFLKKRLGATEKELDDTRERLAREKAQTQSSKEAEKLAFQDPLTTLPNSNMINRYLDFAHKTAKEAGRAIGLFVIDITGFRLLNNTYGQDWGDALLKSVGERLNGMRGASHLVARASQDQFILLAADIERNAAGKFAQEAAKSLLEALAYPFEIEGEEVKLAGAIGAAFGPLEGDNSLDLHSQAMEALSLAKRPQSPKFCLYDDKVRQNKQRESTFTKQMAHAVEKDEFQAVFQPVFHLTKGIVLGLELLLRWEHRDQRVLKPSEFLEPAISSGLIFKIADRVWPKAFKEFAKWRKMRPGLSLSINLSDRELLNPSVLKKAMKLAAENSIDPKSIVFEVRDQSRLRMSPMWWQLLQGYSGAGFGLCLDDFASDASLFGTLAYAGFTQAKMSWDNTKAAKLVAAPQAAKGVEYGIKYVQTKFDKKALAKAGFHLAQGYAVSHPLDYADVDMVLS